jgi:hypothetical protein
MANLDRILTIRVLWASGRGLSVSQPSGDGTTATVSRSCEAVCSTGFLRRPLSLDPPRAEAYRLRKRSTITLGPVALIGPNDRPTLTQHCPEMARADLHVSWVIVDAVTDSAQLPSILRRQYWSHESRFRAAILRNERRREQTRPRLTRPTSISSHRWSAPLKQCSCT